MRVFALVLALWAACCPATPAPLPVVPAAADGVVEQANAVVAHATRVEPGVTSTLETLVSTHHIAFVKLSYRLKTVASTERKIRQILAAHPDVQPSAVRIDDALRYTLRVDDEPAGRYVEVTRAVLAALETKGHVVQYVKNYWPADDNYSGINSVLKHPSGLFWELQFHTSASVAAQDDTRAQYEEFRNVETSLDRRRELFDAMTERWNQVPIPQGALDEGAFHATDQVRERARP